MTARYTAQSAMIVHLQVDGDLPELPAGPQLQVVRIVGEALANACAHSGGNLARVLVRSDAASVRVLVEDDGQGFSMTARDAAPGEHIGLSVMCEARALARRHPRHRERAGRGDPREPGLSEIRRRGGGSESMPTEPHRLRVMIVDDHTLFRSGLSELLERRGIEVCAAVGDGEDGCRLAAEIEPDVVLLDLRMPELDGLSVLERLAGLDLQCAVVMLTTSSDARDLVTSLRAGARGYLLKDMEPGPARGRARRRRRRRDGRRSGDDQRAREGGQGRGSWSQAVLTVSRRSRRASSKFFATSPKGRATRRSPATSASPTGRSSCTYAPFCASSKCARGSRRR